MTETIAASRLELNGGTQTRAAIDSSVVDDYVEAMSEGATFPPVVVFYDGEKHWLADGFHRVQAYLRGGRRDFPADVRQGTRRDAILFSVGANADHGLRRTNADKRRAVETLLNDEEWGAWSDREIARRTGVHNSMVSRVRGASVALRQSTRTVERDGTTYEMTLPAAPTREEPTAPKPERKRPPKPEPEAREPLPGEQSLLNALWHLKQARARLDAAAQEGSPGAVSEAGRVANIIGCVETKIADLREAAAA